VALPTSWPTRLVHENPSRTGPGNCTAEKSREALEIQRLERLLLECPPETVAVAPLHPGSQRKEKPINRGVT
jgi:hypothetical protein